MTKLAKRLLQTCGASLFLAGAIAFCAPAQAQFQLPGAKFSRPPAANTDTPDSSRSRSGSTSGAAAPAPAKPVLLKPPSEDTLADFNLRQNGRRGLMYFRKSGGGLALMKLVLDGYVISEPRKACRVEVPGSAFPVRFSGFTEGLRTYQVDVIDCPFSFTVMHSALIATHKKASSSNELGQGTCEFVKQDCRGYLAGVWGPSGRSFTKDTFRGIEKDRGRSERNARANYRALIRANRGNRKGVRAVAADQAGFSSRREVRCRDYLNEHVHGFCASRVTEARAIQLGARFNDLVKNRADASASKRESRRAQREKQRQ